MRSQFRFLSVALLSFLAFSCELSTDSIANTVKESMQDTNAAVQVDSVEAAVIAGYQVKLQQQKTSIEEVNTMIADFERFETEHSAAEHAEIDTNAVKDVLRMQEEALNKQNEIMEELNHIQSDMESASKSEDLNAKEEEGTM